jgi:hypothetical protein
MYYTIKIGFSIFGKFESVKKAEEVLVEKGYTKANYRNTKDNIWEKGRDVVACIDPIFEPNDPKYMP